jgi:hypothetical protein
MSCTKTCKENYILVLKTCRVPLTKINFQPAIPQRIVSMAVTNRNIKCKLLLVWKPECLEKYCNWRTRRDLQKKRFTDDMQFHVSFRKIAPLGHLLVCRRLSGTSCPVSKELVQTLASRGPGYDGKDARCEERNLDKWKHERFLCDARRDLAWQLLAQENVQWLVVKQIQVSSIIYPCFWCSFLWIVYLVHVFRELRSGKKR